MNRYLNWIYLDYGALKFPERFVEVIPLHIVPQFAELNEHSVDIAELRGYNCGLIFYRDVKQGTFNLCGSSRTLSS